MSQLKPEFVCRLAIDLIDGQVVRLRQGDFKRKSIYAEDPVDSAKKFQDAGITHLHLVDLDGAKAGAPEQLHVLRNIAQAVDLQLDWSGGLKTPEQVQQAFDSGADQVALGSLAVKQPEVFLQILEQHGADRVILAADVRNDKVLVNGWQESADIQLDVFINQMYSYGVSNLLCTDVQQDGMLTGPSTALYARLIESYPALNIIASGGVSQHQDLIDLQQHGITDAIIGRAFYEGHITLEELTQRQSHA